MDTPVEIAGLPETLFAGVCALATDIMTPPSTFESLLAHASHLSATPPAPRFLRGDANDSGAIDIADAIAILSHLFAQTGPLPAPFGECGSDPTTDGLDCAEHTACN